MSTNTDILRSQLEAERKRLSEEIDQLQASLSPSDERREGSPFGKREEEATESFELEKRLALQRKLRENLGDVEHALQKFEEGTYGRCDACGQAIATARLEALPHASLCVECKSRQAKNAKGKPVSG